MRMASERVARAVAIIMLAGALGAAGCRQSNGPMPQPNAERQGDLVDVAKDMMNIQAKDKSASNDLADDLVRFTEKPAPTAAARDLALSVANAIPGTKLTDAQAGELAQKLWVAISADQLSDRQVKAIRIDIATILKNAGAQDPAIEAIGDKVTAMQATITKVHTRWYELF